MAEVGRWKPYTQRQGQLLSALEDALDPGDPVFVINDAVDSLALTPLEQRYAMLDARGSGQRGGRGTGDATDTSARAAAVGAGPVRAAQDAGGAPARRDRVRGFQPAAAVRIRNRVRLMHAGEAAPPARGAE